MSPELEPLDEEDILTVLHRARVVPRKGKLSLQRYPYRHDRRESRRRGVFTLWAGKKPIAHVTVGQSLGGLQRRSQEFHRHNPQISSCPLFYFRHGGIDFFGQEYLGKLNLEEALSAREIDASGWQQAVREVAAALASTTQPSTTSRLTQELAQFEEQVLNLESLNRLDHVFLRDTVFPLIRLGAMSQAPTTAWSNGDFIAKNIFLDPQGRARLVDCEFAHRTHFPAGDWFRLARFSHVPETVRMEDLSGLAQLPPWLEIRCWLEHAVKMAEVCSPLAVQDDLPKISQKLARLVEGATSQQYDSVFFSLAPAPELLAPVALAVPDDAMTVEWSRHGSIQPHQSSRVELQPHHWSEVRVDMSASAGRALVTRLRLPSAPCIVELRSVELHGRERSDILWSVPSAQLDNVVSCSGNILETPTGEGLGLVHFGGESVIAFPPIRLAKSENTIGLAFWMRYVPSVTDFTLRLRQAFADGDVPAILSGGQAIARIESPGSGAKEIVAQLFYPVDNVYREDHSIRAPLQETNAWTELSFEIPALPAGAILRFDPADQPGMIEIARLTVAPVGAPTSDREAWTRATSRIFLGGIKCENDAILVPEDEAVRILSFGTDPALILAPLDDELTGRPLRLSLSLRYSPQVPAAVWSNALRERCDAAISLNVRLHEENTRSDSMAKALGDAAQLEAQLAAARARELEALQAREAELSQRLAQEVQARLETQTNLAAAISREEAEREARAKELQVTEVKHAQLVESLHAQNARLLDVEYQADMMNRELDQARAENARLNSTMATVGQRLLVRLDVKARRLLRAKTREVVPA